jgi:hypothetical protein
VGSLEWATSSQVTRYSAELTSVARWR